MAKNTISNSQGLCKAFSLFIAAMFLLGAFAAIDTNSTAEGAQEQNAVSAAGSLKTITVNVSVYNNVGGTFVDPYVQYLTDETYVFEMVSYVELELHGESLLLKPNGSERNSVLLQSVPDYDYGYRFKCWGFQKDLQVMQNDIGYKIYDDVSDINAVFTNSPVETDQSRLPKLIKQACSLGIYQIKLDCDYVLDYILSRHLFAEAPSFTLDLNGHNIYCSIDNNTTNLTIEDSYGYGALCSYNNVEAPISMMKESEKFVSLTLNGGNIINVHTAVLCKSVKLTMNGGCITSVADDAIKSLVSSDITINGGVIYSYYRSVNLDSGSLTVNGGCFTGCGETNSSCISAYGEYGVIVTMNGGLITRNAGYGIVVENGQFVMNGGEISYNDVGLRLTHTLTTISGGEISYNGLNHAETQMCGGIYFDNSNVRKIILNLRGGSIIGNQCGIGGHAAIYFSNDYQTPYKMSLSGNPVIKDNYIVDPLGNFIPSNLYPSPDRNIVLLDKLSEDACIHVSIDESISEGCAVTVRPKIEQIIDFDSTYAFVCDEPDWYVSFRGEFHIVLKTSEERELCGDYKWRLDGDTLVIEELDESVGHSIRSPGDEWSYIRENVQYIVMPESVRQIADGTFAGFVNLKEVTFPSKVEKIGSEAFYGCSNLKTITFEGRLVTSLGYASFDLTPIKAANGDVDSVNVISPGNWAQNAFKARGVTGEFSIENFEFGTTPSPTPTPTESGSSDLNFILIGGIVAIIVLVLVGIAVVRRK